MERLAPRPCGLHREGRGGQCERKIVAGCFGASPARGYGTCVRRSAISRASIGILARRASCPRTRGCECCARDDSSCPRHGDYSRAKLFVSPERCVHLASKTFCLAREIRLLAVEKMILARMMSHCRRQSFPTRARSYFYQEKPPAAGTLRHTISSGAR